MYRKLIVPSIIALIVLLIYPNNDVRNHARYSFNEFVSNYHQYFRDVSKKKEQSYPKLDISIKYKNKDYQYLVAQDSKKEHVDRAIRLLNLVDQSKIINNQFDGERVFTVKVKGQGKDYQGSLSAEEMENNNSAQVLLTLVKSYLGEKDGVK